MDLIATSQRIRTRVDRWGSAPFFLAIAIPLAVLFVLTGSRSTPYHIDGLTNALTAWKIATHGTVYLDEYSDLTSDEYYGELIWLVSTDEHTVSKYPPGAAAVAAPAYLVAQSTSSLVTGQFLDSETGEWVTTELALPTLFPATLTAAIATAVAMGVLGLVFRSFVGPTTALAAAYLSALGTSVWSVASDLLWQHGPAMMFIAFGLLMMQRERHIAAGLAFGFGVLVRPQVAIIVAITGIVTAIQRRSWKTLFQIGAAASLGLAIYLGYNAVVFDTAAPIPEAAAGYYTGGLQSSPILDDLKDLFLAFLDPRRGLLLWSPFLLVLLPGLRSAWRAAPPWVRGAAIGGFIYLAVQMRGNSFSGGSGFFTYRYPLEMLAAAAPLLLLAHREWVVESTVRTRIFSGTAAMAITAHMIGAIAL